MGGATCGVCLKTRNGMNRVGGMDVCDVCHNGGAGEAVRDRGWSLDSEYWVVETRDRVTHHLRTTGKGPTSSQLKAVFRMKEDLWFWIGLIPFYGISLDDPLFNKLVLATSSTRDQCLSFLESEGAQSAIMDLVGDKAKVTVAGPSVVAHIVSGSAPNEAKIESEVAVLMAHLEAFGSMAEFGGT